MYKGKKVAAIILAGGSGKRMGADVPKQFLELSPGESILGKAVRAFMSEKLLGMIDDYVVTSPKECLEETEEKLESLSGGKCIAVIPGGEERQDSVMRALSHLDGKGYGEGDIVLIHDAARPFVSEKIILDNIAGAHEKKAVITAVPVKDTVRDIDKGTLERERLYQVQTPQSFDFALIKNAEEKAEEEGFYGTDDGGVAERLGIVPEIVKGSYDNIKITTKEDLDTMGSSGNDIKIGHGFDVHVLTEGRKLILGGVEIPFEKGLLGHSDADVLAHALMDAMLGALALGDIGHLFPDSDDRFKGADSMELLAEVTKLVKEKGYSLSNADVTVICERPKLAGHIKEMRGRISEVTGCPPDSVSVKATTTEKLGAMGRGEGIACEAVCLLKR